MNPTSAVTAPALIGGTSPARARSGSPVAVVSAVEAFDIGRILPLVTRACRLPVRRNWPDLAARAARGTRVRRHRHIRVRRVGESVREDAIRDEELS
ncbi:hypothetical protein IFM12276_52260 [Nocardia sputorum]|uniref:Uncharacterized protein n=1 Tax=Nocardia sputorum TaxID=2984338 RepID=A0ABN6UAR5_9NOCA|nr:hypothetical protein IFM12276_52260 [Nocardia sputorum]